MDDHKALVHSSFEPEIGSDVDWTGDTSFAALSVDSLQLFVLLAIAEELADCEFPAALLEQMESVGELVDWTVVVLSQRTSAADSSSDG